MKRILPVLIILALSLAACQFTQPASAPAQPTAPAIVAVQPTSSPPTATLRPTLPPTPKPKPIFTATAEPALIQTTNDGETLMIASPMLALVLPLPGEYGGRVMQGTNNIGIAVYQGQDYTQQVVSDNTAYVERPDDIMVTYDDPSSEFFGKVTSKKGLEIPIFYDLGTNIAKTGWEQGFFSMVQKGRRIILKGTLSIPVDDPNTQQMTGIIQYRFGENSTIVWDQTNQQLIWTNMTISLLPPIK